MGYTKLIAEFISGERNTPAKKLLKKMNLDYITKQKKVSYYSVDINNWNINNIDLIKKIYKL